MSKPEYGTFARGLCACARSNMKVWQAACTGLSGWRWGGTRSSLSSPRARGVLGSFYFSGKTKVIGLICTDYVYDTIYLMGDGDNDKPHQYKIMIVLEIDSNKDVQIAFDFSAAKRHRPNACRATGVCQNPSWFALRDTTRAQGENGKAGGELVVGRSGGRCFGRERS